MTRVYGGGEEWELVRGVGEVATNSARWGGDGGEELRHVKRLEFLKKPSKFAPYARDHRSKLRRCRKR